MNRPFTMILLVVCALAAVSLAQPPGIPHPVPLPLGCWTKWYDRDNPSGTGDWEMLRNLRKENPGEICARPFAIESQTVDTGTPAALTGQQFLYFSPTMGFVCKNSPNQYCLDYKVRFSCACGPPTPPPPGGCWTKWYDRDNPSGTGDWEMLRNLQKENPGEICARPFAIESQTVDTGTPAALTGQQFLHFSPTMGFVCKNSPNQYCLDYKVRFSCACGPPTPPPPGGCWTKWYDRDNPSGTGDWEMLRNLQKENPGEICARPFAIESQTVDTGTPAALTGQQFLHFSPTMGFVCKNSPNQYCLDYKVRFSCACGPPTPPPPGVCWTKWYDRDNPSGTGDWEMLRNLRKENPGEICARPFAIESQTVDTGTPAALTGQQFLYFSPTIGFVCKNSPNQYCLDYQVRFACPCGPPVLPIAAIP